LDDEGKIKYNLEYSGYNSLECINKLSLKRLVINNDEIDLSKIESAIENLTSGYLTVGIYSNYEGLDIKESTSLLNSLTNCTNLKSLALQTELKSSLDLSGLENLEKVYLKTKGDVKLGVGITEVQMWSMEGAVDMSLCTGLLKFSNMHNSNTSEQHKAIIDSLKNASELTYINITPSYRVSELNFSINLKKVTELYLSGGRRLYYRFDRNRKFSFFRKITTRCTTKFIRHKFISKFEKSYIFGFV
jgi:hypothetical protein